MLRKRVVTALCGLPIISLAVWFDHPLPWFTILAALWGVLAVLEFYRLVATAKVPVLISFGIAWTFVFIVSPHAGHDATLPTILTSGIVFSLIWLVLRSHREGAFAGWAWTLAGMLYIGWLMSYLVALRLEAGRNWVYFALFTTFASDTAAYFIGKTFGKHYLAPRISPHKTWEGAAGGILGAVIIGALFSLPSPISIPVDIWLIVLLSALVSIFGQFGDLAKSLLKRNAGVKDSGKLLPGHGGVLDRTDSVIFAGVVAYYAFLLTTG
jgi:phosphatidate cytidylyltransferase